MGTPEIVIGLVVILVLFGGSQIPKLARNLGRAQKEFKDGIDEATKDGASSATSVTDTTGTDSTNSGASQS